MLTFARPELLWFLMVLPVLVLWAIRGQRRRARDWRALAQRGRVPRDGTILLVACVGCLVFAIAQPRWGRMTGLPALPGHDVVLLVDVSRSMGVEDAVPNRLAAAVEAAESLVDALAHESSNRVAVVAFAGRGVLRCPLTENLGAVIDALHRLRPGTVQPGGTDLGAALDAARDAFGTDEHAEGRAVVVFSDGEDHLDRWSARLDRLRQAHIVVHAVSIGDADEGRPVPDGKTGQPFLYHGQAVLSRRNDTILENIARGTDGSIVRLGLATGDLGTLYRTKIEPAARLRRESTRRADRVERFPLFLIAGLAFLVAACWPGWRGGGWFWTGHWVSLWHRPRRKLAVGTLLMTLLGLASGAGESLPRTKSESAAAANARGQTAYRLGRWEEALAQFETAVKRAPTSAIPRYNAAGTLFQLGRYHEAHQRYLEARERAGSSLRTKIDFVLGNTALAEGDIPGAIRSYDECVASTARGAGLEAVRRDAAINRQFATEQQQALAQFEDNSSGDRSRSPNSDRRKNPQKRGKDGDQPPGGQPDGDAGGGDRPEAPANGERPPAGRKRRGGAGGGQSGQPATLSDSPDDRLDAALEEIRAAKNRRLPDEEPPVSANDDRKDW